LGRCVREYGAREGLAMARRNCREENGEIRFDYDMAIAEPFRAAGTATKVDLWPFFKALAQKPMLAIRGELSELLTANTFLRMVETAPNIRTVLIPGVGHAPELNE